MTFPAGKLLSSKSAKNRSLELTRASELTKLPDKIIVTIHLGTEMKKSVAVSFGPFLVALTP